MDDALDPTRLALRAVAFAGLALLAFVPLEHAFGHRRDGQRQGVVTDLAFASVGQALAQLGLALGVGTVLLALEDRVPWPAFTTSLARGPLRTGVEIALGLLAFELCGYGYHRLAHRVPALWRLHEVHHASTSLDALAAFRQHPVEIVLMALVQNAALVVLGLPLGTHATVVVLLKLNTVFVHSRLDVPAGPWTHVLATPAFHRRHHQRDGAVCNFASLFPFLDRLFGTHRDDPAGAVGLPYPVPASFVAMLVRPLMPRASRPDHPVGPEAADGRATLAPG